MATSLSGITLAQVGTGSILERLNHRSTGTSLSRINAGRAGSGPLLKTMKIRSSATPLSTTNVESVRAGSIRETLEHLRQTGSHDLPKELTVGNSDRPNIRHDEWMELGEMPVINLSLLETDRAGVLREICKAANEWGFFQIVNHNVPLEVLHNAQAQGHKFFELPFEVKKKVNVRETDPKEGTRMDRGLLGAYVGDNTKQPQSSLHCAESLAFNLDNREHIWPEEGNETFTDAVAKFGSGLDAVGHQLLGLIAEGLGLAPETFTDQVDGSKALLRWNFYPACPRAMDTAGCLPHTDPFVLTLLLQDQVGGLQVRKSDGEWIGVRPIEGALTVNIGDALHGWTNGICKSVLHRVVLNEEVHRLSIATFLNAYPQTTISAPEELIDDSHPRRYKPFTVMEYFGKGQRYVIEHPNTVRDGVTFLDDVFKV